jgi:hypothetical protein
MEMKAAVIASSQQTSVNICPGTAADFNLFAGDWVYTIFKFKKTFAQKNVHIPTSGIVKG